MKGKRPYEVLADGKSLYHSGRHFGSLAAARSFVARQLRPPSKSGRGWRIFWIRHGEEITIRHNPSGRIYAAQPK